MNPTLQRIIPWLIGVMIPFFLLMTAIRILFTPVYLQVEYRSPGFPPDPYGFTLEDRLHWGRVSMEYLLTGRDINFLASQQLQDGTPLYNERELDHMVDVKVLLQQMIRWWWVLLGVLVALGLSAWLGKWMPLYLRGLGLGGRLTLGLIVVILLAVAVSFNQLFTLFHRLFFTGDTWIFNYSDSLIRLFPLRFWRDAFILMGVITIGGAGLLWWLERKFAHRIMPGG